MRRTQKHQFGRGTSCVPGNLSIMQWTNDSKLVVGSYCSFSSGMTILLGGAHRSDWVSTYPFSDLWSEASQFEGHPASKGGVTIGNDVWVGFGATILDGVSIGDGAVIGAQSVVSSDVPAYSIVAGNPAKEIRKRFDERTIERLLEIRWWSWREDLILDHLPLMLSTDIDAFLEAVARTSLTKETQ